MRSLYAFTRTCLRFPAFFGAMLIVLVELPFLPTVAQEAGVEAFESIDGAGEGAFGTNAAELTCIDDVVRADSFFG